MEGIIH